MKRLFTASQHARMLAALRACPPASGESIEDLQRRLRLALNSSLPKYPNLTIHELGHLPDRQAVIGCLRSLGYHVHRRLGLKEEKKLGRTLQLLRWVRALPVRPPRQRTLSLAGISQFVTSWRKP